MKIKINEMEGQVLDWAVAKCEEQEVVFEDGGLFLPSTFFTDGAPYKPSEDWGQGGPIIERERIGFKYTGTAMEFVAWLNGELSTVNDQHGLTPLIAAMRCFVVSNLGYEVEVPDELFFEESENG